MMLMMMRRLSSLRVRAKRRHVPYICIHIYILYIYTFLVKVTSRTESCTWHPRQMPHGKAHDSLQRLPGRESPASPQVLGWRCIREERPSFWAESKWKVPVLTREARSKDIEKVVLTCANQKRQGFSNKNQDVTTIRSRGHNPLEFFCTPWDPFFRSWSSR